MTTYYVHFNKATMEIVSLSARAEPDEGNGAAKIVEDGIGEEYMLGLRSLTLSTHEIIKLRNETYEFVPKTMVQEVMDRVDVVRTIYEVQEEERDEEVPLQIEMSIFPDEDIVEISYNGDLVQRGQTKFYFTRFNDPSFLKCTFHLDVNTLNQIALVNQITEWPNPIRLKVDNVSDLSVFGIVGQTKATIRNVKASP